MKNRKEGIQFELEARLNGWRQTGWKNMEKKYIRDIVKMHLYCNKSNKAHLRAITIKKVKKFLSNFDDGTNSWAKNDKFFLFHTVNI